MRLFDKLGVFVSGLCLIHCIFLPIIILLLPGTFAYFEHDHDGAHQLFLVAVVLAVLFSFIPGYRTHKHIGPFLVSVLGVICLTVAAIPHLAHELLGHEMEIFISIIGSLLMIGAHIYNHRLCKVCTHHACDIKDDKYVIDKIAHSKTKTIFYVDTTGVSEKETAAFLSKAKNRFKGRK